MGYRVYNDEGVAMVDLIQLRHEEPPQVGKQIMVRHPLIESKRAHVTPKKIVKLHVPVWDAGGFVGDEFASLKELKNRTAESLSSIREDVKRELIRHRTRFQSQIISTIFCTT